MTESTHARDFLEAASGHMQDRAATYDNPTGERSMGRTVAAFNIITGHQLTEEEGWLFMGVLKKVRSVQGDFRADNYEDDAAYAALRGEAAKRDRRRREAEQKQTKESTEAALETYDKLLQEASKRADRAAWVTHETTETQKKTGE